MTLNAEAIAQLLTAATVAISTAAALARGSGTARAKLLDDIEVLKSLPADSAARERMLAHVDQQVNALTRGEQGSRHWSMFAVAVIASAGLGMATIRLAQRGDAWGVTAATITGALALVFVYGIFETAAKVPRDTHGKRLPDKDEAAAE